MRGTITRQPEENPWILNFDRLIVYLVQARDAKIYVTIVEAGRSWLYQKRGLDSLCRMYDIRV